ncbi:MAG TPA: hypothetical protein VLM40_11030, partial [Gemmata sp.]|nr:hypothetical protein [Gemmata sp.]
WVFLIDPPRFFDMSLGSPSVAAIFTAGAGVGLLLSVCTRKVGGTIIRHSVAAGIVNGLLLALALVRLIQWLFIAEQPGPSHDF